MKHILFMLIATAAFNATAKAQTPKACDRCRQIDALIARDNVEDSSRLLSEPLSSDPEIQAQEADAITRAAVKWALGDQITQEMYVSAYRDYPKSMGPALEKVPGAAKGMLKKLIRDYSRNPKGNH